LSNVDDNDLAGTTDNPNLHICGNAIVTERQLNDNLWEYTLSAQLTNSGTSLSGITARLVALPVDFQLVKNTLIFGATHQGDTLLSEDTLTLRSPYQVSAATFRQGIGFKWNVTVEP
jgi:hypothetical protein